MLEPQLKRLEVIYDAIDSTYESALSHYHFNCTGCETNCCETRFYHYTIIEALYLQAGFNTLDRAEREHITALAKEYAELCSQSSEDTLVMCPININQLCSLYKWRPMICRLHGIPFEVQDINMNAQFHGGCQRFINEGKSDLYSYRTINRTIFYREMARLEGETREILQRDAPQPMTAAQIILSIE